MNKMNNRLPFVLETIGESLKQPTIIRENEFGVHQFIWVKKGEGKFSIDGKSFFLGEGDGMFMRRNVPHSYSGETNEFHTVWCTFTDGDGLVNYSVGNKNYLLFHVNDHIKSEFRMLRDIAKSNTTPYKVSSAGYAFVCDLFENITKTKDDVIGKVKEYMENNCHMPITLDDVANVTGLDRYKLCRYFKKNNSKSVMDELLDIRIGKAKRLLRYSSENVETIAIMCGFESPSYFSMKFREKCSCTPTEYRNKRR